VQQTRQFVDRVTGAGAGGKAALEILRDGKPMNVQVEIGERPTDLEAFAAGGAAGVESWRGLKVARVSAEAAEQFGVAPDTAGVLVVELEPDSPAEASGLRPGDVINEINRVRIANLDDYRKATAAVKGNALVRTNRGYVVIKAGG
jgi:serine protease Do